VRGSLVAQNLGRLDLGRRATSDEFTAAQKRHANGESDEEHAECSKHSEDPFQARAIATKFSACSRSRSSLYELRDSIAQQATMFADGTRQRTYANDVSVDFDDLGHCACVSFAHHEPSALTEQGGVSSFVGEAPRETRFVLAVEVDEKVKFREVGGRHGITHRSTDS